MRTLIWSLFALLAGALWATCFGVNGFLIAPWLGLAPLLVLLGRADSGRLALVWGLGFWMVSLHWIVPTMVTFGGLSALVTWPLFTLLAAFLAVFVVAFALLTRRAWASGRPLLAMLALAAVWGALEWVRAWFLGGFPWNLVGYAWVEVPGALETSAWIGAYGVSMLVVWANAGFARGLLDRDWRPIAWGLLVPLTILGTAWRWSERAEPVDAWASVPLEVRVLQPDIPNQRGWDPDRSRSDYQRLIRQSLEACDRSGVLLIWPESAAWPRQLGRDLDLERDLKTLGDRGCAVLLNNARSEGEVYYNAAVLVRPDGRRPAYDKRHLVPFGEYIPFRGLLPFAEPLTRNVGEFTPGEQIDLLEFGGSKLGAAICYEVVFPGEVAATVRAGATVLVSITNDDWYGPTSAAWQHLRAARFRAAETRRTLLRAAITGVSAVIAPDGALLDYAAPGERRTLSATVEPRTDTTLYVRFAGWVPWMSILVAGFAIFLSTYGRH